MNNISIIALLEDLQMSACLAKISTVHSYILKFYDNIKDISNAKKSSVLLIDLNSVASEDLSKVYILKKKYDLTCLGYCEKVNSSMMSYFKTIGFDMVMKRFDLMKNLEAILQSIRVGT